MSGWERLGGMVIRWYALAIVVYAVLLALWVFSGSSSYNMIINMIVGLSGLVAVIIVIEVLRRKIKLND